MLLSDIWSDKFVFEPTSPNDMISLGTYIHSALGKPYLFWGLAENAGDTFCSRNASIRNTCPYGYDDVLEELDRLSIRARFTPGNFLLNERGESDISRTLGVVDKNFKHDPVGRYALQPTKRGGLEVKQLRFMRGNPQLKRRDGDWGPIWGYILEDELEHCVEWHIQRLEQSILPNPEICTCKDLCCKQCLETI